MSKMFDMNSVAAILKSKYPNMAVKKLLFANSPFFNGIREIICPHNLQYHACRDIECIVEFIHREERAGHDGPDD